MNEALQFSLFANCIPIKGSIRSVIYDIQYERFVFVPNDLVDILIKFNNKKFNCIISELGVSNFGILKEYFSFLESKNFIFWLDTDFDLNKLFPRLSMKWDYPGLISNMIIDIQESTFNFENHFQKIKYLGCKHIQLRSFEDKSIDFLEKFYKKARIR